MHHKVHILQPTQDILTHQSKLHNQNKVLTYLDKKGDIVSWCSTLASQCELLWLGEKQKSVN